MASSTSNKHIWLMIFIVFNTFFVTSKAARFIYQNKVPQVQIRAFDSQLFLLKLGYDSFTLEKYRRRSLVADRVAPAGPNGQHHSLPPSSS
ncbi:hypothetical protein DCAR_0625028 [Daucus carota subsp. sativus]|uniref:Uncharacterized protein n=1 Tax=Daucus carota subsp. sativus TaxID=79200 RepID=A0AAF0XEN6_DAUCS|nr:hypothetical protein DCAR_0625028 [Daucus carota subsp. sativus]